MSQITVGSKINLNGATRLLDATGLKSLKYQTGQVGNPSAPSGYTPTAKWQSGGSGYTWLSGGTSPSYFPCWTTQPQNDESHVFPNQDAISLLGIPIGSPGDLYSLDGNGNLVIQPRLLTAAEKATVVEAANNAAANGGNPPQSYPQPPQSYMADNCTWLSGGFTSLPMGISPPFLIGARVQLPYPFVTGMWPAIWCLKTLGGWPPEIDILECVQQSGGAQTFQLSLHSSTVSGDGGPTVGVTGLNGQAFHDFWCVMYGDYISIFIDGVCEASFATPSDFTAQNFYMIVSYQLAGPGNNWPGALASNLTTLPPMTIADVIACDMPATYGSGTAISYVAPSGPSAIAFNGVTPTPTPSPTPVPTPTSNFTATVTSTPITAGSTFTISGTAGTEWVNIAAYDVNGNKICSDVTPSSAGAFSLSCNTSTLVTGSNTVDVMAFSTPAGVTGGTSMTLSPSITIAAAAPVVTPPATVNAELATIEAEITAAQTALSNANSALTSAQAAFATAVSAFNAAVATAQTDITTGAASLATAQTNLTAVVKAY